MTPLLELRDLHVQYPSTRGSVRAVDGFSLAIERGQTYALVGESGCGKTAAALSILRLVEPGRIVSGAILFDGLDLMQLSEKQLRPYRGGRIGMIFQEPAAALNPVLRIGTQVSEALRIHKGLDRKGAWTEAVRLLRVVSLPDPERQAKSYPHELSGGMKQRVMIAIALSCGPDLLVADEPTTALDVTIQAQILALLRSLKQQLRLTVLLITHDLGVVAENADRVGVMYAGRMVEESPVARIFSDPKHPYTKGLLESMPDAGVARGAGPRRALLTIPGAVPDPSDPPPGCRFHPRCARRFEPCATIEPVDLACGAGQRVACHLHDPVHSKAAVS